MAKVSEVLIATFHAIYDTDTLRYRLRDGDNNLFKAINPKTWDRLNIDAIQIEECVRKLSAKRRKMKDAAASAKSFVIVSSSNPKLKVYVTPSQEENANAYSLRCVLEVTKVSYTPQTEEVNMAKRRKAAPKVDKKKVEAVKEEVVNEQTTEAPETAEKTTTENATAEAATKKRAEKKAAANEKVEARKAKLMKILEDGAEMNETIYDELECPEELTSFQTLFTETGLFYSDKTVYGQLQKETGTPYKVGSVRSEIWAMFRQGAFTKETVGKAFETSASERTIASVINVSLREGTIMEVKHGKKNYLVPFVFRIEEGLEEEDTEEEAAE